MGTRTALLAAAVAASALAVVPSAVADPGAEAGPWKGSATGWGGTATYDGHEWVHQDFVYDDYGADTCSCGQPNVISLVGTTGDFRYPDGDRFRDNAADIVEVRVRPKGPSVRVRVLLSTIVDPAVPALYVAHGDRERIVTVRDDDASIDAEANTIEFQLPGGKADTLELLIGAGLHDGSGGLRAGMTGTAALFPEEFTTGGPATGGPVASRLFDLAFNTEELEGRGGGWNEDAQAAALQNGELGPFTAEIDLAALRTGKGAPFTLSAGYHVAVFESRQDLGEGMAASFPQYRGRHQPYAVWVPEGYDPSDPAPLYLSMHSLNSSHNQYRGGDGTGATYATYYEQLGDFRDFEDAPDAVVVTPLGRGPDGWYEAEGLVDTFEVWSDALDRFTIDRDRVHAGGYSMGGYGTYRLSTLVPDAIASATVVVGPMTNGIWAYPLPPETDGREDRPDNTYHQLESTRHIPTSIKHGTNDELVPVSGVTHHAMRFDELGHEYRYDLYPGQDHLSFAFADDWLPEAEWIARHPTRTTTPRRVTLDIRPSTWSEGAGDRAPTILALLEELTAEVGADLRGGYWVRDVVPRTTDGDATASVDLRSEAVPVEDEVAARITEPGVSRIGPYVRQAIEHTTVGAPVADAVSGSLTNVASLTIDLERSGLSDAPDLSGIRSDGPVTITLVRSGRIVQRVVVS